MIAISIVLCTAAAVGVHAATAAPAGGPAPSSWAQGLIAIAFLATVHRSKGGTARLA